MLLDAQNLFSDGQALTADADSTNYIDLSVARNLGVGRTLYVALAVTVAMTDSGSDSTVTVSAEYDSTTTFTPDATQQLFIIPALTAAGTLYYAPLAPLPSTLYRYVQLTYVMTNGDLTTGTVTAGIVLDIDKNFAYADGITIS